MKPSWHNGFLNERRRTGYVLLIFVGATFAAFYIYKYHVRSIHLMQALVRSERWKSRVAVLTSELYTENSVVLLGDSLSAQFPISILNQKNVISFGVNGDFASTLVTRLAPLAKTPPEHIFLMIGINDIVAHTPMDDIRQNYSTIINWISNHCPETTLHIQSCLPTSFESGLFADNTRTNRQVISLNRFLAEFCRYQDIDFIDLYSHLADDGELSHNLTTDGIHLNTQGYRLWGDEINKRLSAAQNADSTFLSQ